VDPFQETTRVGGYPSCVALGDALKYILEVKDGYSKECKSRDATPRTALESKQKEFLSHLKKYSREYTYKLENRDCKDGEPFAIIPDY